MAGLINDLIDKLDEMANIAVSLIEVAEAKKDVLVKNDIDTLKRITAHENTVVGRYQRIEKAVASLLDDCATVLAADREDLTLTKLGDLIKEQDDYPAYSEVCGRLRESLVTLKERNDLNGVLLENALDYIEYTVNALRTTHNSDGESLIDSKN